MKHRGCPLLLGIVWIGSSLSIEAHAADEAFSKALVNSLNDAGRKLVALAEATPPERFSWQPTADVRSVSQVYMHVVGNNLQIPAVLGAKPVPGIEVPSRPFDRRMQKLRWEEEIRDKEQVVDRLRMSLSYASSAIGEIEALDEIVAPFGFRASKRDLLILLVNHAHEHLGQAIAYARLAGIIPPWSAASESPRSESVAVRESGEVRGEIVDVDRFGNLHTDLVGSDLVWLGAVVGDTLIAAVGEQRIEVFLGETAMDVGEGEWFAVVGTDGRVMIGRSYQSAAAKLNCRAGDSISVRLTK